MDDNFLELLVVELFGLLFVGQHEERLVVLAEDVVDVDAYQYLDFADVTQLFAQLKVARRTEEAYHCQEAVEGAHL